VEYESKSITAFEPFDSAKPSSGLSVEPDGHPTTFNEGNTIVGVGYWLDAYLPVQ
jgi:hypothetical protein